MRLDDLPGGRPRPGEWLNAFPAAISAPEQRPVAASAD